MKAILCDGCMKMIIGTDDQTVREIEMRKSDGNLTEKEGYFKKEICMECALKVEKLLSGDRNG